MKPNGIIKEMCMTGVLSASHPEGRDEAVRACSINKYFKAADGARGSEALWLKASCITADYEEYYLLDS